MNHPWLVIALVSAVIVILTTRPAPKTDEAATPHHGRGHSLLQAP